MNFLLGCLLAEATDYPQIVLVIIDGCGVNHFEAARLVEFGSSNDSVIKEFTELRPLSTQNKDNNLTDSAAAATAISSGIRTLNSHVGVDEDGRPLQNIIEYLNKNHPEYLTGVVSKVHSAHATPAGFLAHNPDRYQYSQIYQSILDYNKADLILGAGDTEDLAQPYFEKFKNLGYNVIGYSDFEKDNMIIQRTHLPIFGQFKGKQLAYYIDQPQNEPNLTHLTHYAINKLGANNTPFFLMVECSLNDVGSHNNNASYTIGEMIEADYLLRYLINRTSTNPNMHVIVAADHETGGLTIPDDLSELQNASVELPSPRNSVEVNNQIRNKRIELLHLNYSTSAHSNAFTLLGGYGPLFSGPSQITQGCTHTQDIRTLIQHMIDNSTELRPYDYLRHNPDGNMFVNRTGLYPAQIEDEPYTSAPKKKADVVPMVVGILIGVMFVGILIPTIYYCVKNKRHHVQETYIHMESSAAPLQDQPEQNNAQQPIGRKDEGELE